MALKRSRRSKAGTPKVPEVVRSADPEKPALSSANLPVDLKSSPREVTVNSADPLVTVDQLMGSKELTPVLGDPLTRYMAEIRRYPVLSAEEQTELAKKFIETGDPAIAKRLIVTNLRLVVKIAMEYRNSYQNVLDLIQEGNVGLLKAVSNYDPYKGTRLSYYASWWIRSYILKFLLDNFRLVKIGTTQAQKKLFYNLMREKERLEAQGLEAGPKLLADRLQVKESDVTQMGVRLSGQGSEISLDHPNNNGGGEGQAPRDYLEQDAVPPDEELALAQLKNVLMEKVDSFVETLNEKERMVFHDRLLSDNPLTLQEIADKYGITRERSRQIEVKVIEKLREHLRSDIDGLPLGKAKR